MLPDLVTPHRSRGVSRALGALTARRWLAAVAGAWIAAAGCGPQTPPTGPAAERLIGDSFSEARITWEYVHFDERVIDFTSTAELDGIRVGGARHRLGPDGLLVSALSNDPILAFDDPAMPYNFIRIAMASSVSGNLQVFWSGGGSPFAPERRKTIPVRASAQPATYAVDLSGDLAPSGHRFRIDPIDRQAEVRIRTITFSRAVATPAGSEAVRAGKVKIGREVREALMLRAGAGIERRIRGGEGTKLVFGLARSRGSQDPVRFRITLGGAALFEEQLGIGGEGAWRDREVALTACPRAGCAVTLEVSPEAAAEVRPAVFVSNPVVVDGGERRLPHVILISLDTLGARHLRSFGGPAGSSPHLEAFARQAVVFENGFANSSATHTSHGSLLTGSAPFSTGYYWLDGAVDGEVTLADALRRHGYLTAAFTGGVLVSEALGFDKGFETFYQHDTLYRQPAEHSDVDSILARARAWLERHADAPTFLFVHSYEVHGPYVSRDDPSLPLDQRYLNAVHMRGKLPIDASELPRFVRKLSGGGVISLAEAGIPLAGVGSVKSAYHSEIRFLDQALGRFFDALDHIGLGDDAVVVLTADHGEAFFEHGLMEHGLLYDENLRIPLIIRAPGRLGPGKRIPQQVSSIDVAPTILDLVGLPIPAAMEGRSLVPLVGGEEEADRDFYSLVLGNGLSFQAGGRYKLIVRAALGQENFGINELFDLVEDPLEQRNLLAEGIEIPEPLHRQMRQTIAQFPGVHIDFGALADQTYELEFAAGRGYRDRVYAFDTQRVGPVAEEDPSTLRCVLTFSETSRLVLRSKGLQVALSLRPADGGKAFSFLLEPPDVSGEKRDVPARRGGGGPTLSVWRVSEAGDSAAGFSPEEKEKLRALGYIQ